jgi:hypothetical protein
LNAERLMSRPDSLPGSFTTKAPKAKKEFSSVIEQAMRRRVVSSRSARLSALQLDNASPGPGHVKAARLPKPETREPDIGRAPTDRVQEQANRAHGGEDGSLAAATGAETPPATDDAVASEASGVELSALPDGLPQNVIPFPTPSVIIPFPLAEAKAKGTSARALEGALGDEALGETPSLNVTGSISTTNGAISKPATNVSSDASDGFDVSELGLARVGELEKPMNVHKVEFASASAQDDAAQRESTVISVAFRTAGSADALQRAQTQLPSPSGASEECAPMDGSLAPVTEPRPLLPDSTKTAVHAVLAGTQPRGTGFAEATGISVARQKGRMESLSNSETGSAHLSGVRREPGVAVESPAGAASDVRENEEVLDFSARTLSATEWQTGRPVSSSDRPASDVPGLRVDTTGTVERISRLVLAEVALIKQHSSDSLAVVLRPDAETELFVHLTQRNGKIEATVRCERGDLQHLSALWGQLQESLAHQKVRLAPLEQPPSNQSNFHQPTGLDANSGQGSPRQSPEKQSMDEWPAPATSSADSAHVRGRRGSRHRRLTTSRPGWETWA